MTAFNPASVALKCKHGCETESQERSAWRASALRHDDLLIWSLSTSMGDGRRESWGESHACELTDGNTKLKLKVQKNEDCEGSCGTFGCVFGSVSPKREFVSTAALSGGQKCGKQMTR